MKKTVNIEGMHCVSCELLIQKSLEEIHGIKVLKISHKKGILEVEIPNTTYHSKIEKMIEKLGYKIGNENVVLDCKINEKKNWKNKKNLIQLFLIIIGWVGIFMILRKFDIVRLLPSLGDSVGVGVALLMGLVASVSTCLAITGSIVLGFSQFIDDSKGGKGHLKTQIGFQIGRIIGFFILGGTLGLVGSVFKLSFTFNAILTIIVGIVVIYMGLNMLGILPSITSLGFHLPKSRTKNILTTKNPAFAPIIGMLTFFLPCGFTQSMQFIAINSGNFWQAGLIMAMFALGTMPVLLAIGLGTDFIKDKKMGLVIKIIGVLVIFFGAYSISNGRGLIGKGGNTGNQNQNNSFCNVNKSDCTDLTGDENISFEKIEISHDGRGLVPEVTTLKAGGNYEIIILPLTNGKGCMNNLLIPKIDKTVYDVIKGKPIIYKVKKIQAGTYKIVCGNMGMSQGKIVVE